jgi:hypothetical protein
MIQHLEKFVSVSLREEAGEVAFTLRIEDHDRVWDLILRRHVRHRLRPQLGLILRRQLHLRIRKWNIPCA